MKPIVSVINEAIRKAGAECLPCDRVNLDYERHGEYRDSDEHRANEVFENPPPTSRIRVLPEVGPGIPPTLRYFLDGSRRTYKVADLLVRGHYLPLIAGQVAVAVLHRDPDSLALRPVRELCKLTNVLAFPDQITNADDLKELASQIRHGTGHSFELLRYTVKDDRDPVDLGIAKIMSFMADLELNSVHSLSDSHLLHSSSVLVKDGPLRYRNLKGRSFDITQFRNVIGLSKTFRPSFAVGSGRSKRDVGTITAALEMGQRTPVFKTLEEDRYIGMWYLRIRPRRQMTNPLQGIVKVECYAIDDREMQDGLDADRVNTLSAHVLRERNVTPYGQDVRWASHIYPIYASESFMKASFLSDIRFEAMF